MYLSTLILTTMVMIVKQILSQPVKDPVYLITMVTPSKPIHGTKSWINSETFLNDLHLTQKGR